MNLISRIKDYLNAKRYDSKADFFRNIQNVQKITGQNPELLMSLVFKYNIEPRTSWHFLIIPALIEKLSKRVRFLEIGTFDGQFSSFLANNFDLDVYTVDLPLTDERFIGSYGRNDSETLSKFVARRSEALRHKRIFFKQIDSLNLLDHFSKREFDVIWLDGDHLGPQIYYDLLSSINLINPAGYIVVDDVITADSNDGYTSTESFLAIQDLAARDIIKFDLILKRISPKNLKLSTRKYIAVISLMNQA